jgi:hypothetical protein
MTTPLPRPTLALLFPLVAAFLFLAQPAGAMPLERDWCSGVSPVSWGFSVTPAAACRELRLKLLSPKVRLLSAAGGPSLPEGWEVVLESDTEVIARGPSALAAGQPLASLFLLQTNRATALIGRRGADAVRWELTTADETGLAIGPEPDHAEFPPVLELGDALSRGLVQAWLAPRSAWGPAEVTVDNPTWQALWLDLTPGTLLEAGGREWVVGGSRPFKMNRKQKTSQTILAFPVEPPPAGTPTPGRLRLTGGRHAQSEQISALVLSVRQLDDRSAAGLRRPGAFEAFSPWDFWPLALQWAIWSELGEPTPGVLRRQVEALIASKAEAGDTQVGNLDVSEAVSEVQRSLLELRAEQRALRTGPGLDAKQRLDRRRF